MRIKSISNPDYLRSLSSGEGFRVRLKLNFGKVLLVFLFGLLAFTLQAQNQKTNKPIVFNEAKLSPEAKLWYKRFWQAVESSRWKLEMSKLADSGDLFAYGRPLNTNITAVLMVQRETGDLRLLDVVDRYMQQMRGQLKDYNQDGFLNWRYLNSNANKQLLGNDVGASSMWEMETHALVAMVAYIFRQNQNQKSPAGINYKERADFWQNYLVKHFEPKWRQRNNKPTGFPFLERMLVHPFVHFMRYHYYMGFLTGQSGYQEYAVKMFHKLQEYTHEIPTSAGPALVWQHQLLEAKRACQPTMYARSTLTAIQDLSLAGFAPFADKNIMTKYARTISELMNLQDLTMKKDVCGEENRGVIISDPKTGEFAKPASAITPEIYSTQTTAGYLQWDSSQKIKKFSLAVYQKLEADPEKPTRIIIPAAMFLGAIKQTK